MPMYTTVSLIDENEVTSYILSNYGNRIGKSSWILNPILRRSLFEIPVDEQFSSLISLKV